MRYLSITAPRQAEVTESDALELEPAHVRVQVSYAAVCHSDLARVAEGQGPFPLRLGHETSGVVTESTDPAVRLGTRVSCYTGGGYSTEMVVPVSRLVRLDDGCSLLAGALAEPFACVIGGLEMIDMTRASRVVLVGAGFMGLMALRYLASNGHRVVVIEPRERARAVAAASGAYDVLVPEDASAESIGVNSIVIEATGSASGLDLAGALTEIGGTLGIMGYHQSNGGKRTVDMQSWNYKALRVINLHHREPADVMRWMDRAQRISSVGWASPETLVDSVVDLEELPAQVTSTSHGDHIKTVVRMGGDA